MKTKDDYLALAAARIANYPKVALLYQARDPRILALLDAMATMLAMHSVEQDVNAMEPWTKARDVTVLADAAIKGVLPYGTPIELSWTVENVTSTAFKVLTGRRMLDPQGRVHVVTVGATVPALGTAVVQTIQQTEVALAHTVTADQAFYPITLATPDVGYFAGVRVTDASSNTFTYTPEFTNVEIAAKVFHLESDENRALTVVFGADAIGGYQPSLNEVITVTTLVTEGDIDLAVGASAAFEYTPTVWESGAKITLAQVLVPGAAPMSIDTMREVTSYASLYDSNAVYLSNFDFLLRRNISDFRFLSVWNEQMEETVRGASVDHINCLFVASMKDGVDDATLFAEIKSVIATADDSYRVKQVALAETAIPVTVLIEVPDIYDSDAVEQAARELILEQYGRDSAWAKKGRGRVLYRKISSLLEGGIQACQETTSDIQVTVTDEDTILPESYRYVSDASLTVTVENPDA